MRVFVSEFVCGGAWEEGPLEGSLAREGRAMLLAACEDFARVPGCEVRTTWDARLGPFPLHQVDVEVVPSAQREAKTFDRLVQECDATFVIAPEFEGLLARKCARVREFGGRLLGSSTSAIELCADKLRLFAHLEERGLPSVTTRPWSHQDSSPPFEYPFVVKPRDGAGSLHTYFVSNPQEWNLARSVYAELPSSWEGIAQPFVEGRAMSVGAFITEQPQPMVVFPPAEQRLSDDGRFRYCGGSIDGSARLSRENEMLIRKACTSIPGLSGYVGIDYLVPRNAPDKTVIVEINSRLTTSYLGYRAVCEENLLARFFEESVHDRPIEWSSCAVAFTPDGNLERN